VKWLRLSSLVFALALCAPAADLTGTWKAVFLGPKEKQPKTVGSITFDFKADGTVLTGMVHAGSWPGDAPISDGKIEGDHVSFFIVGTGAWHSRGPQGEASGYPRLTFQGTVNGKEMTLTLVWDSIMIYGNASGSNEWQMQGKKTSE
jgi:hypothetical protein